MASASVSSSSVGAFLSSLSNAEIDSINPAELFKFVEYVVLYETRSVSLNSTLQEVRDAVFFWCASYLNDITADVESSPWFYCHIQEEPVDIRRAVALLRQRIAASRRRESQQSAEEEVRELNSLSGEAREELFRP
jgi:hypothetical protein